MTGTGPIACTVDENLNLHFETVRWFATLTRIAGVDPSDLYVNVVGGQVSDLLAHLESRGVTLLHVEPFDARWAWCNKISGAKAVAGLDVDGVAVLTDADTAFVADPRSIEVPAGAIAGRPVDAANPPLLRVLAAYERAGFDQPRVCSASQVAEPTIVPNLNGGFLLLGQGELGALADAWGRWADWLLDSGVLGDPPYFAGQMSTALAITDLGLQVMDVGPEWNLPTHTPEWYRLDQPEPWMVHYHRAVTPNGLIAQIGVPRVDRVIDRMNAAIVEEFAELFASGRA